jgi:hypothetical protein
MITNLNFMLMKIKINSCVLLCFLTLNVYSQNVIKVRSKHTKVLVYTMKEGEYISRNESKILIKNTGADFEFVVENKKREYNLIKNGKSLGITDTYRFSDDEYWKTSTLSGETKMYYLHLKNGKKFGPFSSVYPVTTYKNQKSIIDGYQYTKDDKYYFHSFHLNKTFGPYDNFSINNSEKGMLYFTYKFNNQDYVYINSKIFGPYSEARISLPYYSNDDRSRFCIKYKNASGDWKVFHEKELNYVFKYNPNIEFLENNLIKITGSLKSDTDLESVILKDKVYKYKYNKYEFASNSVGDGMQIIKSSDNDSVFIDNKLIGVFKTFTIYKSSVIESDFYNILLQKKTADNKTEYFLCKNKELVSIGKDLEIDGYKIKIFKNDYFYMRNSDSTLIKNGKETEFKGIKNFHFNEKNQQVMLIKNGNFDDFYLDGKKLNYEQAKSAGLNPEWYNVKGKDFNYETVDDKTYIIPKGSTKKYGPVIRGNKFVFSHGNLHYGECDEYKMNIFIDGKLFSSGFALVNNPTTNEFHWLSTDKNKVYFHTLIND